jgi:hypothetical protein
MAEIIPMPDEKLRIKLAALMKRAIVATDELNQLKWQVHKLVDGWPGINKHELMENIHAITINTTVKWKAQQLDVHDACEEAVQLLFSEGMSDSHEDDSVNRPMAKVK